MGPARDGARWHSSGARFRGPRLAHALAAHPDAYNDEIVLDAGFYSRLREVNPNSSFSVNG